METTALAKLEGRRRSRQANPGPASPLGEWVRSARVAQGVSQRELAERAGLSRSYLCDIEHGRSHKPSFDSLQSIASALGVDRTDLLRVAGILEPARQPEENARERKLISIYRGINERNQLALESYARFLLSEEQRWVQPKLVDADGDRSVDQRATPSGPTLFDLIESK